MHKYEGVPVLIQAPILDKHSEKGSESLDHSYPVEKDGSVGSVSRDSQDTDHPDTLLDPKEGFPR